MPFDGMPIIEKPAPKGGGGHSPCVFIVNPSNPPADKITSVPGWRAKRGPEGVDSTIAVLVRARALIAEERNWCKLTFARGWGHIPVPPRSRFARRFCAIGAVKRAASELLLPTQNARIALEAQTRREVERWNDDRLRTHAEVIAVFDSAIAALEKTAISETA
jgi:hypothetical protein